MKHRIYATIDNTGPVIAIIDHNKLHKFILNVIGNELNNLVEDCYYPKIANIFKDMYYLTNTDDKKLKLYSKTRYPDKKWNLLHNPKTTLLVLITQEFIKRNDMAAAKATFHLFSLMYYTNLMHKYIRYCNPNYFRTALNNLSHNHLFISKKTIGSSVVYLSSAVFIRREAVLRQDDADGIQKTIFELRHRLNQSVQSFARKYYEISKTGGVITSEENDDDRKEKELYDRKLRGLSSLISKDVCVYGKIDDKATRNAIALTKFNRKTSAEYSSELAKVGYSDELEICVYLLLKNVTDLSFVKSVKFLDYVQKLMAVKVSKKPVYFKKSLIILHDEIVASLNYQEWFDGLSIQSKSVSRKYLAYYIAFIVRHHVT